MKYINCPVCTTPTQDVIPDNVPGGINDRKCTDCGAIFFRHPEQLENEVFFINIIDGEIWNKPSFVESLRIGKIAYTTNGKEIVKGYKPLFGILKK